VAAGATLGLGQQLHQFEAGLLHTLDDQLSDPIAAPQLDGLGPIVIDDDHLQLAPVARVDGCGSVEQSETGSPGKARAGVEEAGITGRQRDREAGRQQRPLAGLQLDVDHRAQIGTGVAVQGVAGQRSLWMQPPHLNRHRRLHRLHRLHRLPSDCTALAGRCPQLSDGHSAKGYPRCVTQPSTDQPRPAARHGHYSEKLRTPWWWYLAALAVAALLGAEFALAFTGWIAWLPLVLLVPLCLLVVWRLSSGRIAVIGGQLQVGDRRLALADIEQSFSLSPTELRRLVGRHSDPLAYTFIRSWIGPGVQLVLRERVADLGADSADVDNDAPDGLAEPGSAAQGGLAKPSSAAEGDPAEQRYGEPYWLLSTRHPDQLLAAVHAAAPV
jgi:hypothetical protein